MIELKKGNLFNQSAEAIVNTVNCVGVMGKGIALQCKERYPEVYIEYRVACNKNLVRPGSMFVCETNSLLEPYYIINFPTKRHWRENSRLEDIESGLIDLRKILCERNIQSVAIPPLGCGNGGLAWDIVKPLIEKTTADLDLKVYLFEPSLKETE
jgi:O-acetyl-ADP-ribose deacetylase (regulator of RNase III)